MSCTQCYKDWISCGNTTLNVTGTLEPDTAYIWTLENKGAKYQGEVTTDANGNFTFPVSELPDGLLNPYAGSFVLSVVANDAYQCASATWNDGAYCDSYDCIEFEVVNGTAEKNTLGCPCDGAVIPIEDLPYKVYTAFVSVSGANTPIVNVINNSLGATIAWTHGDVGESWGTLSSGTFPQGKTFLFIDPDKILSIIDGHIVNYNWLVRFDDKVEIITVEPGTGETNDFDIEVMIEIRVYP